MPVKRSDWPEFRSACCAVRIVNTREHYCVWYQRCSEVLIAVATKKQCLPFENEIKYREKTATPTFKITIYIYIYIYISQTRLTGMNLLNLVEKLAKSEVRKSSNNVT